MGIYNNIIYYTLLHSCYVIYVIHYYTYVCISTLCMLLYSTGIYIYIYPDLIQKINIVEILHGLREVTKVVLISC